MTHYEGMAVIFFVLAVIALVLFYFFPALVASGRGHHNSTAIAVLNFFLGWTFVGWVVALVWACTDPRRRGRVEDSDEEDDDVDKIAIYCPKCHYALEA